MKILCETVQMEIEESYFEPKIKDDLCSDIENILASENYEPKPEIIEIDDDEDEEETVFIQNSEEHQTNGLSRIKEKPITKVENNAKNVANQNEIVKSKTPEREDDDDDGIGNWDLYKYLLGAEAEDDISYENPTGKKNAPKKYVCYDCGFQTNHTEEFSKHMLYQHNNDQGDDNDDDILECLKCDYQTHNKQYMKNHMRNRHLPRRATKCGQCSYETRSKPQMARHVKEEHTEHEVKYHQCTRCQYRTKWKHHIKEHYMFHHNVGEIEWFKCPVEECDYQTKWKYHIKQHIKCKHSEENKPSRYQCSKCEFSTQWKPHYVKHLTMMHGLQGPQRKMHQCAECAYRTNNSSNLKVHVAARHRKDEGGEVYRCDQCGFQSKWKHHIKNHKMMKHGDTSLVPTFRCDECDYESKWKHHVKAHKESKHTALPCSDCQYVAHTKMELRQHQRDNHTNQHSILPARLICNQCPFVTMSPQHMVQHVNTSHNNNLPQRNYAPRMNIYSPRHNQVIFRNFVNNTRPGYMIPFGGQHFKKFPNVHTNIIKDEYLDNSSREYRANNFSNNIRPILNNRLKNNTVVPNHNNIRFNMNNNIRFNMNQGNVRMNMNNRHTDMNISNNNTLKNISPPIKAIEVSFNNHSGMLKMMYDKNLIMKNHTNNINNGNNHVEKEIDKITENDVSVRKRNRTEVVPMLMLKCNECSYETDCISSLKNHVSSKHVNKMKRVDEMKTQLKEDRCNISLLSGMDMLPPEISITPVVINK